MRPTYNMIQISPRWGNTLVKTNPGTNEPQQIETTLKEQNTPKIRPVHTIRKTDQTEQPRLEPKNNQDGTKRTQWSRNKSIADDS